MASTIITAPSTNIPKSSAPKLIRFAHTPNKFIMIKANSNAKETPVTISGLVMGMLVRVIASALGRRRMEWMPTAAMSI